MSSSLPASLGQVHKAYYQGLRAKLGFVPPSPSLFVMMQSERDLDGSQGDPWVGERQICHVDSVHMEGVLLREKKWKRVEGKGKGKTGLWEQKLWKRRSREVEK